MPNERAILVHTAVVVVLDPAAGADRTGTAAAAAAAVAEHRNTSRATQSAAAAGAVSAAAEVAAAAAVARSVGVGLIVAAAVSAVPAAESASSHASGGCGVNAAWEKQTNRNHCCYDHDGNDDHDDATNGNALVVALRVAAVQSATRSGQR